MKRGPKKVVFIFAFARFLYKSIRNLSKIGKMREVHDPEKKSDESGVGGVVGVGWVGKSEKNGVSFFGKWGSFLCFAGLLMKIWET